MKSTAPKLSSSKLRLLLWPRAFFFTTAFAQPHLSTGFTIQMNKNSRRRSVARTSKKPVVVTLRFYLGLAHPPVAPPFLRAGRMGQGDAPSEKTC